MVTGGVRFDPPPPEKTNKSTGQTVHHGFTRTCARNTTYLCVCARTENREGPRAGRGRVPQADDTALSDMPWKVRLEHEVE